MEVEDQGMIIAPVQGDNGHAADPQVPTPRHTVARPTAGESAPS